MDRRGMNAERRHGALALALLLAMQLFAACSVVLRAPTGPEGASPMPAHDAGDTKAADAAAPKDAAGSPAKTDDDAADEEGEGEGGGGSEAKAAVPAPNDCISSKCHTTILSKKNVHDAAEGCTDCHNAVGGAHPVKGQKTFELLNTVPDLCYACHDEYGKKKTVHSPVEDGSCTDCHDPHSTTEPGLLKATLGDVCKDCHEGPTDHPNLHGPVADGDCVSCHEPHESDTAWLLLKDQPSLCVECHTDKEDELKMAVVHSPAEDSCTDCHDPHGSEHPVLLVEKGTALCFSCHESTKDEIAAAKVTHDPMEDDDEACATCHAPHASEHASLLLEAPREVCLECHDATVPRDVPVLHGKNRDGNCAACHTPHGGEVAGLLKAAFPGGNYQRWDEKAYPLCFECHERTLVSEAETGSATAFREGRKNLHTVHVDDGDKGRSCAMCHDVHGTRGPMLVRDELEYGKWTMKLKFRKTDTGGSCAPGCHKPLVYDRENPGRRYQGAGIDKGA